MLKRIKNLLNGLWVFIFLLFIAHSIASDITYKQDIEKYFEDLMQNFNTIAESQQIRKTSLSQVDRYFVSELKKNQTWYTLIKTNSKGVLTNEVIRGLSPETKFKDVGTQKWYYQVSRKLKDYHGFLKDENGRFYLFWAKPLLKKTGSNPQQYFGAVAVKVDIWDCFHKLASDVDKPFLVRLGRKSLYSNKWKKENIFEEKLLQIPGITKITIRYEKIDTLQTPSDTAVSPVTASDTTVTELKTEPVSAATVEKPKEKSIKNPFDKMSNLQKIVLFAILLSVLVLIVYLSKLAAKIKDWRLRRKIEKEDNLFH